MSEKTGMSHSTFLKTMVQWIEEDAIHSGKLNCLFKSLSINSHGFYSTKHTKMSLQRFEFFVDDFFFYTSTYTRKDFLAFISNRFDQRSSVSTILGTPHNRIFLSFKDFLGLLVEISVSRNRGKRTMKSVKKLLRIIYESEKYQQYKNLLPLSLWNELKDLKKVFFKYDNPLRRLFKHFSQKKSGTKSSQTMSRRGSFLSKGRSKVRTMIKYTDLVRFCQSLGLSQSSSRGVSISQFEIRRIYRSLFSHSHRSEPNQIDFDTFRTFMTRLCLFYFIRPSTAECKKTNDVLLLIFFKRFIHPLFRKVFGKDIERYLVDLDSIPPPELLDITPDYSSFESNSLIRIRGRGFDFRKGGVYLRLKTPMKEINVSCRYPEDDSQSTDHEEEEEILSPEDEPGDEFGLFTPNTNSVFRQFNASNFDELVKRTQNMEKYVRQRENVIVCNVPIIDPNEEVEGTRLIVLIQPATKANPNIVDPHFPRTRYRYCYEVRVFNYLRVSASVTNDLEVYGRNPMSFYYVDRMEPFLIGSEITVLILEYFRTFQFLDIEKWEGLKKFIRERLSNQCIFKDPTKKELNLQYSVIQSVRGEEDEILLEAKDEEEGVGINYHSENPMSEIKGGEDDEKMKKKRKKSRKKYVMGMNEEVSRCSASDSLSSFQHKINGTISIERFLKLLVVFSLTEVQGLHPLDFLINLIQLHQVVKYEEEYLQKVRISRPPPTTYRKVLSGILGQGFGGKGREEEEKNRILKMNLYIRYRREFDVFYGPILIGMIYEKGKGHVPSPSTKIRRGGEGMNLFRGGNRYRNMEDVLRVDEQRTSFLKKKMTTENTWFGYIQYNTFREKIVTRVLEFSENFDHLISRFLGYGFDLTTAYRNTTSRTPIGRNWEILSKKGRRRRRRSSQFMNENNMKKKSSNLMISRSLRRRRRNLGESEDGEDGPNENEDQQQQDEDVVSEERVGVLLDYCGQFGTLQWNPSYTDLLSKYFTLCCYSPVEERANFFLEVFRKSKCLKELRSKMEQNGYRFRLKIC